MSDVKAWLETTGLPVAEIKFSNKNVVPPFVVYTESRQIRGTDEKNCIAERDIRVELYCVKISPAIESKIEALLDKIPYNRERLWIAEESVFMTVYEFSLVEVI
jgi:hypothetical protein